MASSFTLVTRATVPVEQLFDVSLSIDEHVASMDQSGEQAIAGVTGGSIGLGEMVTWRARHFGIWFTMTSQITSLERPDRFVDEQVRGPFRSFHHEHTFTRDGEGTVMVDTLTIGSPIFGRLAERVILVPYLRRLIRQRNHHLLTTLDAAPGTDPQLPTWPVSESSPFRRFEATALIGHGDEVWERASRDVLRWKVKTRSGFTVEDARRVVARRGTDDHRSGRRRHNQRTCSSGTRHRGSRHESDSPTEHLQGIRSPARKRSSCTGTATTCSSPSDHSPRQQRAAVACALPAPACRPSVARRRYLRALR